MSRCTGRGREVGEQDGGGHEGDRIAADPPARLCRGDQDSPVAGPMVAMPCLVACASALARLS